MPNKPAHHRLHPAMALAVWRGLGELVVLQVWRLREWRTGRS